MRAGIENDQAIRLAYAHALQARRDLARALELEDTPSALHAAVTWAEWIEHGRRLERGRPSCN